MKLLPPSEAAPMIACLYAAERAVVRLCEHFGQIEEAREIAASQRCSLAEAADIVRRSRR